MWKHNGDIEVIAGVPDEPRKRHAVPDGEDAYVPFGDKVEMELPDPHAPRRWRSISWLESLGLLPAFADLLEQKTCAAHGDEPPPMPIAEWTAVRDALAMFWHPARQIMEGTGRPHVFVGPAGSGKTTALCKWATAAVLAENQTARVWRLDGETANLSEFLSLQCELIGVPVERFWRSDEWRVTSDENEPIPSPDTRHPSPDLLLVDFPGVEPRNGQALSALRVQVAALPHPHVHLVLNAATDTSILFEQFNAFAPLIPEDVIFTHLDEEQRRVKLWNFVLGTNLPVSFLGAGQKIPGEFRRAESALLFPFENRR